MNNLYKTDGFERKKQECTHDIFSVLPEQIRRGELSRPQLYEIVMECMRKLEKGETRTGC